MARSLTLLVITDGRHDCLQRTLSHLDLAVRTHRFDRRVVVNDSLDPDYGNWVDTLGFDTHIRSVGRKRGFGGAIEAGWAEVVSSDYVFHLEDDFVLLRHVDVDAMIGVIESHPHLAQMALRRQAVNEFEVAAGGIVESNPTDYTDAHDDRGRFWLEHRRFFTTNPSVYPQWVVARGWPPVPESEGIFGHQLFTDPTIRSAFWGKRSDQPWCHHIGAQRVGQGY